MTYKGSERTMENFKQRLYENGYFRQEELTFRDCGPDQRARVSAILSKMACFAGYDYDARGLTHETLRANREVFLLSRAAVRIHDCPRAGEVLDIATWEAGVKAAHMRRNYEMTDREGRVRVSARTDWILVDPETRKILRPSSFTAKPLLNDPRPLDCPSTRKVVVPQEGREALGVRTVRWSDLDGNGHLFSGNYGDVIWDALPEDLRARTPRAFHINYSREAVLGDALTLEGRRGEEGYFVEGMGPHGPCFTALCVF